MGNGITENLLLQLSKKELTYENFLENSEKDMISKNIKDFWFNLIEEYDVNKADIINKADIGYTYFYDIIRGDKCPTRDKLMRIFLAIGLPLETCQKIFKMYGWAELYSRDKRDSAFIFAITHSLSVQQLIELLNTNNFESLK